MSLLTLALTAVLLNAPPELSPRETADVGDRGQLSVGVFNPLTYAVADGLELRAHPVLFFVSPNLIARVAHLRQGPLRLTGEYGLSVPTPLLRLTQGYLFPSWERSGQQIGWYVVPRAGLVASVDPRVGHVLTLLTDLAVGIPLTSNDATPLGAPAPLEMLLAPALNGYRAHAGALYDLRLAPRWRARAYVDAYLVGRGAPMTFRAGAAVDWGAFRSGRFTLGVVYWNSDQFARDPVTFRRVRSHDILPTFDVIWEL
jgi:hypothetical protein